MATEIERKFLVVSDSFRASAVESRHIIQGYITRSQDRVVRVRVAGDCGYLTVKTANTGAVRGEWEFAIPVADARDLLGICQGRIIAKTRYIIPADNGLRWEVDVFENDLAGLVTAEIELPSADTPFTLPAFVGREVTDDPRYFNSALATQD